MCFVFTRKQSRMFNFSKFEHFLLLTFYYLKHKNFTTLNNLKYVAKMTVVNIYAKCFVSFNNTVLPIDQTMHCDKYYLIDLTLYACISLVISLNNNFKI